jgi:AcrR family transcriptional regulator
MVIPGPSSHWDAAAAPAEAGWTEHQPDLPWTALGTEEKHERILCAAGRVFARDGLDAPMPAVAAEAGAGVASLYRQFPSKRDLLAALVIRRLWQTHEAAVAAAAATGDHWQALKEMLWLTVERHAADDFLGEAWSQVEDHDRVRVAAAVTQNAFTRVIDLARAEGGIRADATAFDVRLLFMATRTARQVHADAWKRVLELMLDGLGADPQP